MTLDLILFRPEFFLLFGFFVLLWYGTGNLVTPVAEILTVTKQNGPTRNSTSQGGRTQSNQPVRQSRGPNHAASALTQWAVVWCFLSFQQAVSCPMHIVFLGGSFQKDAYSLQLCRLLFLTRCFVLRVSYGWQKVARICHTEYVYLAMQALIGQYQQIMATDLMSLYLCMEQQSFSLVVLCGLNSKSAYSLEAAMKYFLLSAFRSCQLLQGVGFIYWQTGETSLPHIEKIVERTRNNPSQLTALGIWLISTGLLWKQAAAPQHFWVPDVYMGAWSSVSQWITVQPKIAVLGFWTHHWHTIWSMSFGNALILFRAFSMIVGRIAPQAQTNIKRQLAYSSVGHMGQLLMPQCRNRLNPVTQGVGYSNIFTEMPGDSVGVLWSYMIIYVIINLGVWGMQFWPIYRPVSLFVRTKQNTERRKRPVDETVSLSNRRAPQFLWDLKGMNQSSAPAAFRWAVFMTSLAGLPPVYSFQGKAAIIWHAVNNGLFILVAVAQAYTMIGSVYYLKVMKICYVDNPTSWRSYGKVSPVTAYIIAISVSIMMIGLWWGNALFLFTHILALSVSSKKKFIYLFLLQLLQMYTTFSFFKWRQAFVSLWYCPGCFSCILVRTREVRTSFTQTIWSNSLGFAIFGFIIWLSTQVFLIYGYKPFQNYLLVFIDISILSRILLALCQSCYYSDLLYFFEKTFAFQWSAADSQDHVTSFIQSDGAFAQAIAQAIDLPLNQRICIVALTINVFCGGKFPASAQLTRYFGFISDAYPKQTEDMTLERVVDARKKAKKQSVLVEQLLKFSPWFIAAILELFNVQVKGRASQGLTLPEQVKLQARLFPLFDAANAAVGRLASGFVLSGNELASRYRKHKAEKSALEPKTRGGKTTKAKKALLIN